MSCICGYLHFTRDLQYEFFYLSQYILQFIILNIVSVYAKKILLMERGCNRMRAYRILVAVSLKYKKHQEN